MGVSLVTVADSISKITLNTGSALTIKDLDTMLDEVFDRECPVIMPAPTWLGDPAYEDDALGSGSGTPRTITYTLGYRMFYQPLGQGRQKMGDIMPGMAQEFVYFMDALLANDNLTGCVDIRLSGAPDFGVVEDPVGNLFWGTDLDLIVTELEN